MRAFQMSNFKNKNCSEFLLTNGMGLDGAPVKFLTLVFLRPPTPHVLFLYISSNSFSPFSRHPLTFSPFLDIFFIFFLFLDTFSPANCQQQLSKKVRCKTVTNRSDKQPLRYLDAAQIQRCNMASHFFLTFLTAGGSTDMHQVSHIDVPCLLLSEW